MRSSSKALTPAEYIRSLPEPRRGDVAELDRLIRSAAPKLKREMLGGMLGYGKYHYRYESGREGDCSLIGLASQKNYISLYVCAVSKGKYVAELHKKELPKANVGRSCIRFKSLDDVDTDVLRAIIREAVKAGGMARA